MILKFYSLYVNKLNDNKLTSLLAVGVVKAETKQTVVPYVSIVPSLSL